MRQARNNNDETLLVLEDNGYFSQTTKARNIFITAMQELPADWDILYLRFAYSYALKRYTNHLGRVVAGINAHAYVIHKRCIDRLIQFLETYFNKKKVLPIDEICSELWEKREFQVFATHPLIAEQRFDFRSSISRNVFSKDNFFNAPFKRVYAYTLAPCLNTICLHKYHFMNIFYGT